MSLIEAVAKRRQVHSRMELCFIGLLVVLLSLVIVADRDGSWPFLLLPIGVLAVLALVVATALLLIEAKLPPTGRNRPQSWAASIISAAIHAIACAGAFAGLDVLAHGEIEKPLWTVALFAFLGMMIFNRARHRLPGRLAG